MRPDSKQLIEEAKMIAILIHANQQYDMFPYAEKHVQDVVNILVAHGYDADDIIAAWLHDTGEDGTMTYSKVKKLFGLNVAEIWLACTDPADVRNRKEKKERMYIKVTAYPKAKPTKLADRIANMSHGIRMENVDKLEMYVSEDKEFRTRLYLESEIRYQSLWDDLGVVVAKAQEVIKKHGKSKVQRSKVIS